MATIDGLPPLREVIATHGLSAKKSLGQNFLLDLNLTAKIARQAGDLATRDVLEIGPGPGGLTRGLLAEGARKVIAIEKDARCLPALADIAEAYPGRLTILNEDALDVDAWILQRMWDATLWRFHAEHGVAAFENVILGIRWGRGRFRRIERSAATRVGDAARWLRFRAARGRTS